MNTHKSSKLPYLITVLAIALLFLAYLYWSGSNGPESMTLEELDGSNQEVGVKVLNLLNEINSLNIDKQFFKDQAYQTLQDYTVEIPALPVGRSNPFSPVPGMPSISPGTR